MLGKLLGHLARLPVSILTTAAPSGVATRYVSAIGGALVAGLGLLGWLDAGQVEALREAVPEVLAAFGGAWSAAVMVYAIVTKSRGSV